MSLEHELKKLIRQWRWTAISFAESGRHVSASAFYDVADELEGTMNRFNEDVSTLPKDSAER